ASRGGSEADCAELVGIANHGDAGHAAGVGLEPDRAVDPIALMAPQGRAAVDLADVPGEHRRFGLCEHSGHGAAHLVGAPDPPAAVVSTTSGASTEIVSSSETSPCAAPRNISVSSRWASASTGRRGACPRTWVRARLTSWRTEASERSRVAETSL